MGTRMLSDTGHRGVCIQSMGNFDDDISKGLEEKTVSGIILAGTSTGYKVERGENLRKTVIFYGDLTYDKIISIMTLDRYKEVASWIKLQV